MYVNTHKITLVLHAPPDTWGWARPSIPRPESNVAADPVQHGKRYEYTEAESNAIWMASGPFAGTPA